MNQAILKKMRIVSDLVCKVYGKDIDEYALHKSMSGDIRPRVIFTNKPDQSFCVAFIIKDNWVDIKRKMSKLVESDGICVVCFEKETKKFVEEFPTHDSNFCFNCCEVLCETCFDKLSTDACVVCRKGQDELNTYYLDSIHSSNK